MRLNDHLLAKAKGYAAETGRTLTALIEDSLRTFMALEERTSSRKKVRLKTIGGKGLQRGVDLDSSATLLELMERGDGAS